MWQMLLPLCSEMGEGKKGVKGHEGARGGGAGGAGRCSCCRNPLQTDAFPELQLGQEAPLKHPRAQRCLLSRPPPAHPFVLTAAAHMLLSPKKSKVIFTARLRSEDFLS